MSKFVNAQSILASLPVTELAPEKYNFMTPGNASLGSRIGPQSISQLEESAVGATTLAAGMNLTYNIVPASGLMDGAPSVRFGQHVTLTRSGGGNVSIADLYNRFGLASFPISRVTNTYTISFHGYSQTTQPSQLIDFIEKSISLEQGNSMTQASKPDNTTAYNSAVLDDPLRWGADTISQNESRGFGNRYPIYNLVQTDAATIDFDIQPTERIIAEGFQYSELYPKPLRDVSTMNVQQVLGDDLGKMFANGTAYTDLQFAFSSTVASPVEAGAYFIATTQNPSYKISVPDVIVYNSQHIERFSGTVANLTSGSSATINTGALALSSVPSLLAINVAQTVRTNYGPVITPAITSCAVRANNSNAQLSELNEDSLYKLSVGNGYNMRYASFAQLNETFGAGPGNLYGNGSMLFIRPSDLSLGDLQSNMDESVKLTFQLGVQNRTNATMSNLQWQVYVVYDSLLVDSLGTYSSSLALIDKDRLVSNSKLIYIGDPTSQNSVLGGASGAGFFGDLWTGIKNVGSFLAPAIKAVSPIVRNLPGLSGIVGDGTILGTAAKALGGKRGPKKASSAAVARRRKGGSVLRVGGAQLSHDDLMEMNVVDQAISRRRAPQSSRYVEEEEEYSEDEY